MREKLSKILREVRDSGWLLGKFCVEQYPPDNAYLDQILTLLREEIKKELLTGEGLGAEIDNSLSTSREQVAEVIAKAQLQKILKALEEK